jgi:hypothetical protein
MKDTTNSMTKVTLEDETIDIRDNLWQFLWALRSLKGEIKIWVDYLCISQNDKAEKNHQVKLMAAIFSAATDVYAWLGQSTINSVKAFKYIQRMSHPNRDLLIRSQNRRQRNAAQRYINDLTDREYWTRTWIIQEVLLARNFWVMVGTDMLNWDQLQDQITDKMLPPRPRYLSRQMFQMIWKSRRQLPLEPTMEALLSSYHHTQCSNPLDRIFAMLGMIDKVTQSKIIVEYDRSPLQACVDNMAFMISKPDSSDNPQRHTRTNGPFDPITVIDIILGVYGRDVSQLESLHRTHSLRNQLDCNILIDCTLWPIYTICCTFAGVCVPRHSTDMRIEPIMGYCAPNSYQVFISLLDIDDGDGIWGKTPTFLYSTIFPAKGDVFLDVDSSWLIARRHQGCYRVIEMATVAASWAGHIVEGPRIRKMTDPKPRRRVGMVNPLNWLKGRMPDQHFGPVRSKLGKPGKRNEFSVQFNGAALAEAVRNEHLLRTMPNYFPIDWDPHILIHHLEFGRPTPDQTTTEPKSYSLKPVIRPGARLHSFVPQFKYDWSTESQAPRLC